MTSFPLAHLISKRSAGRIPFAGFLPDSIPESIKPHPNPISLAGGEPYHEFFPVHSLQVEVTDTPFYGKRSEISSESDRVNSQLLTPADSIDSLNQKENSFSFTINRTSNKEQCIGIDKGLQYAHTAGLKPMLDFTFEFIEKTNKPAFRNYDITLTNGSGNSLHRIAELLVDEGDTFLVEEFTYKPFCQQVTNFGGMPIPVKLDFYGEGIHYESLKDLLENWSKYYPGLKKPKGLYTICNGQNPSGLTQSLELRKKIYKLAEIHDFIIVEDDPYGYLIMPPYKDFKLGNVTLDITPEDYVSKLLPSSYLTIDTVGRVIRCESFSKIFAPGLRLGFIVCHKEFTQRINIYGGITTGFSAGVSQMLVTNTIDQLGGFNGWIEWLIKLRNEYTYRRNAMLDILYNSKAFKNGLIDPIDPNCGMFVIVIVKFNRPETEYKELIQKLIYKTIENGVNVVPGTNMMFDEKSISRANFMRLTFSTLEDNDEISEATKRFTKSIEEFFSDLQIE